MGCATPHFLLTTGPRNGWHLNRGEKFAEQRQEFGDLYGRLYGDIIRKSKIENNWKYRNIGDARVAYWWFFSVTNVTLITKWNDLIHLSALFIEDIFLLCLFSVYLCIWNLQFGCSCLVFPTHPLQDPIK